MYLLQLWCEPMTHCHVKLLVYYYCIYVVLIDINQWVVMQERTTDDSKESESLKQLLTARMQEFIEEMLIPHFGGMMTFVKECETAFDRGNIEALKSQERTSEHCWCFSTRFSYMKLLLFCCWFQTAISRAWYCIPDYQYTADPVFYTVWNKYFFTQLFSPTYTLCHCYSL